MSSFFNSELIQKELQEISDLQEFLCESIFTFAIMPREEKIEHIDKMTELLEKQQIMYTRLSLSDDPEAIEIKENLRRSVVLMGFAEDTDMGVLFGNMKKTIEALKKYLD
jgi:predicted RNA-binding protein YlqC (UPF0109 family)